MAVRSVSDPLLRLTLLFLQMSLLAFGEANTILPALQRQVVDVNHMMVICLIGWHVAGRSAAVLTTVCALTPSGILTFLVALAWERFRDTPWRKAIQKGLLPVTAGLLLSSAALLIEATTLDWSLGLLTLAVTVLLLTTKVHPMLVLGGAAGLGALGVVG